MVFLFSVLYWVFVSIAVIVALMIVYHIWTYYLNKNLAISTIIFFIITFLILILINYALFSSVDLEKLFSSIF